MHRILREIELVVLCVAMLTFVIAIALWSSPYRLLRVQSGSMRPLFDRHDALLIDTRVQHPQLGAVIAYRNPVGATITHRFIGTTSHGQLVTRGDALHDQDSPVLPSDVQGQAVLVVGGFGAVLDAVHTPLGFVALVLVPLSFILAVELAEIIRHVQHTVYRAQPSY